MNSRLNLYIITAFEHKNSYAVFNKPIIMTATAEDWIRRIEEVLDKYGLSKEEYWKDPNKFYENIQDEEIRAFLWWAREMC